MRDDTNNILIELDNKYNITRDEVYTLLNQGVSKITYKTVERWYSKPDGGTYVKMQGHWFDLLIYRLKEKYGQAYFKKIKSPLI